VKSAQISLGHIEVLGARPFGFHRGRCSHHHFFQLHSGVALHIHDEQGVVMIIIEIYVFVVLGFQLQAIEGNIGQCEFHSPERLACHRHSVLKQCHLAGYAVHSAGSQLHAHLLGLHVLRDQYHARSQARYQFIGCHICIH
jgi:hypothetical protein